jgi:RNA polymerase sigma factor for flagellar operon FliA
MKAINPASAAWDAYTRAKTPEMREKLLVQYMPLVKRIALRMLGSLPRSVRIEDLESAGVMGLLASLDNFDPSLGIKFETFAMNRIRGAMVDSLREMDWVPRSVRKKARELEKVIEGMLQELGRTPSEEELAKRLSLNLDDLHKLLDEVHVTVLLSLDETFLMDSGGQSDLSDLAADFTTPTHQDRIEESELRETLIDQLKSLPEQEKLVLALYYYEELTLKEIGDILSLTESRVSQIHSKAILELRSSLHLTMSR